VLYNSNARRSFRFSLASLLLIFVFLASGAVSPLWSQGPLKEVSFKGTHNSYDQAHDIATQIDEFGVWVVEIDMCGIDDDDALQVKHGCDFSSSKLFEDILQDVQSSSAWPQRVIFLWLDIKEECFAQCRWREYDDDERADKIADALLDTIGIDRLYTRDDWDADERVWPTVDDLVLRGKNFIPIYDNNDHNPDHSTLFVSAHKPSVIQEHTAFLNVKDAKINTFPGRSPRDADRFLWRSYDLNTEHEWRSAINHGIHLPSTDEYQQKWSFRGVVKNAEDSFDNTQDTTGQVVLWEGNQATQDLVCAANLAPNRSINFQNNSLGCDNDEARSLVLENAPLGQVVRLFDSSSASRADDWTEIRLKTSQEIFQLDSFQNSFENSDVRVIHHRHNGLDGKVSFMDLATSPTGAWVDFYEGNNATQDLICGINASVNQSLHLPAGSCSNDEARSLVLFDLPAGRAVRLFDSPSGQTEDDWVEIEALQTVSQRTLSTFESSFNDGQLRVSFFRNNGLDGKVSRIEIGPPNVTSGILSFYEGNGGTQNKVCDLTAGNFWVNFKNHSQCDNDEARSLVLTNVSAGYHLRVYDSPSCSTGDDWTEIEVLQNVAQATLWSFEQTFNNGVLRVTHHHDNGLDGKVSCVRSP